MKINKEIADPKWGIEGTTKIYPPPPHSVGG